MTRTCGSCSLCCSLMPVRELAKGASERCKHQSHARGCRVYGKPAMPPSCRLWNCRWIVSQEGTETLSRPDRSKYVIDILPDFITARDDETGVETSVEVVQIWCSPSHPNAHRDPALRAYLHKLSAEQGIAALVRYNAIDAFVLVAPPQSGGAGWLELKTAASERKEHSLADVEKALGGTLQINLIETGPHA